PMGSRLWRPVARARRRPLGRVPLEPDFPRLPLHPAQPEIPLPARTARPHHDQPPTLSHELEFAAEPQLYCRFVYLPCFLDSFREGGGRILPRSDGGAAAPGRTEPSPGAAEPRVQRWNANNAPPLHISSTGCPRAPERVFRAFPQDIHTEGRRGGRGALSQGPCPTPGPPTGESGARAPRAPRISSADAPLHSGSRRLLSSGPERTGPDHAPQTPRDRLASFPRLVFSLSLEHEVCHETCPQKRALTDRTPHRASKASSSPGSDRSIIRYVS